MATAVTNGLIDLEDAIYHLYLTVYPSGKAAKSTVDALPSQIVSLNSQYPEAMAHVISSRAYRLTKRVIFPPLHVERSQSGPLIRSRPPCSNKCSFDFHQDLALAVQRVITQLAESKTLKELTRTVFRSTSKNMLRTCN